MGKSVYILFGWGKSYNYIHELAKTLVQRDDIDAVGGMVNHERYYEYLVEQNEVDYEVLDCIPNVHERLSNEEYDERRLEELEDQFGIPSLWSFLLADRDYVRYDHRRQQNLLVNWFDFYLDRFAEFTPDIYLGYSIAAAYTWIPYHIVSELGGRAISWQSTRLKDRYALKIDDPYEQFDEIRDQFEAFRDGDADPSDYPDARYNAKTFLTEFRDQGLTPAYFSSPDTVINIGSILKSIKLPAKALRRVIEYNFGDDTVKRDYRTDPTWKRVLDVSQSAYRKGRIRFGSIFEEPDLDEDFVFFPLHLQPEASTMLLAPMYLDQPAVVRQVARSLPIGHKLYVKEHPNMLGERSLAYYDQFADLSNVKVIDPLADSHELIRSADMVTTITGTAGWEALLYQKPVMTFGNVFYNALDLVFEATDPDEYATQLYEGIYEYSHDETELREYLTAIFAGSFVLPGGGFPSSVKGSEERAMSIFEQIEPYIDSDVEVKQETFQNI